MALETIKLQTNIPLVGLITGAAHAGGKEWTDPNTGEVKQLPDQVAIVGNWDGVGPRRLYLDVTLGLELVNLGVLKMDVPPPPAAQQARWAVLVSNRKVQILKKEEGKRKPVYVTWANGGGPPPAAPASVPTPAAAPPSAPPPPRPTPTDAEKHAAQLRLHRRRLVEMRDTMGAALDVAKQVWDQRLERWYTEAQPRKLTDMEYLTLIQKTGSSLAIQMFRESVVIPAPAPAPAPVPEAKPAPPPPPVPPVSRGQDPFPADLEEGEDDELPF